MNSFDFDQIFNEYPKISFLFLYIIISFSISLGGWGTLTKQYANRSPFKGKRFFFASCSIGSFTHYRSRLIMGSNENGLYLAALLPFRIGHPPLFIPWSDIVVKLKKGVIFSDASFDFSKCPEIIFEISKSLAEKLAKESGGNLKLE